MEENRHKEEAKAGSVRDTRNTKYENSERYTDLEKTGVMRMGV